jgi:hypothetical protein
MKNKILAVIGVIASIYTVVVISSGCAQIGAPVGGDKDTLAPVLIKATPAVNSLLFKGNKITLYFDEFVTTEEIQNNLLVSPLPENSPNISNNLKTVTIKLRDSLLPNTTYSIQFGNAIRDINESNILSDFTYVFSTGNVIDSLMLAGNVHLAETGLIDSTISVLLYRNNSDTAVQKTKPNYLAKTKGDGSFKFNHLPAGSYKIYALKDGDGSKNYNSKSELFAFSDEIVILTDSTLQVDLNAFAEEGAKDNKIISVLKPAMEKKLKYSSSISGPQDLLTPLELRFNNPLKRIDSSMIMLTDSNYKKIEGGLAMIDSSRKTISYNPVWMAGTAYRIILSTSALEDSAGNKLAKTDTIAFTSKQESDYGRVVLRFKNLDLSKNPVLQLVSSGAIKYTSPLNGTEWKNNRIVPGEYDIRILWDRNKDGKWTTGNYAKKQQPETAISISKKLAVRADWDNENDISL